MIHISHLRRPAGKDAPALAGFAVGAASVLTVHQGILWALHQRGAAPWPAFSTAPTEPLGVPEFVSAAFWGGLWGAVLAGPMLRKPTHGAGFWARAAALGAVLPTAVGAGLVAAGRGRPLADVDPAQALAAALLVNAGWGAATAAGLRLLDRRRREHVS